MVLFAQLTTMLHIAANLGDCDAGASFGVGGQLSLLFIVGAVLLLAVCCCRNDKASKSKHEVWVSEWPVTEAVLAAKQRRESAYVKLISHPQVLSMYLLLTRISEEDDPFLLAVETTLTILARTGCDCCAAKHAYHMIRKLCHEGLTRVDLDDDETYSRLQLALRIEYWFATRTLSPL